MSEEEKNSTQVAKENAEASIASAQIAKSNADASIASAQIAKENADASIVNAQTAKNSSDAAIASAEIAQENEKSSAISASNAKENADAAVSGAKSVKDALAKTEQAREKAEEEARNAANAHQMSTTVGLAGAFNVKANAAIKSMRWWSLALAVALGIIFWIGYLRFDKISTLITALMAQGTPMTAIGAELLLSILSFAAPV